MTHDERVALAKEITERVLEKHCDDVLAIGIYGSTGKNEDIEHSDLEMWIATTDAVPKGGKISVYRGMVVELNFVPEAEMLKNARGVRASWPIYADGYRHYILLHDRNGFVGRLREATENLDDEEFQRAIRELMVETFETVGKLRNARSRKDRYCTIGMSRWIGYQAAMLTGLANRRYYHSDRLLYQMSKEMDVQIPRYRELLDVAGAFSTTDPDRVYEAALALWGEMEEFVRERGIAWTDESFPI